MPLRRREFLNHVGLGAALAAAAGCRVSESSAGVSGHAAVSADPDRWTQVRQLFRLSPDYVHMSALLIVSHPAPVREAIERYRDEIDRDPVMTVERHNRTRQQRVREAAGRYLGVDASQIALTDSTTMGVGLVYNGLRLRAGDEIVTTEQDYYVTHEALRHAADRYGAKVTRVPLYDDATRVSRDQLVGRIRAAIGPRTRVAALTWVHSSTGVKLPLAEIAAAIADANRTRDEADRVLVSIDGVHGFGIEDLDLGSLGIDFFAAGGHKWLFGPRGTGILWASRRGWQASRPIIPSFIDDGTWSAWLNGAEPDGPVSATRMTPGGFKAFEHQWALAEAFELHQQIGKADVQARTHELATQLKEGLAGMAHVRLATPMSSALSSGIVSFDVNGLDPWKAVERLREEHAVIATVTPYAVRHVRLTPSIRNTPGEVDRALAAVRALA